MPAWYDKAQQDIVSGATTAAKDIPALADTSAGAAIEQFKDDSTTNPFKNAQSTLNQIGTGAANPWITDASGNVRPDTTTAMGGLFQAQNQALNQLMPSYTAPVQGANIASGQFGSLRGQTAVNKAMADAQAQLFERQMQAALQNQQTGVSAATGLGNVGSQGVTSMTSLGQAEQSDPLFASSAVGKIVGGINTPTTTTNETQLSPLNQIGSLVSALGGSISGTNKFLTDLGVKGGIKGFLDNIKISSGGGGTLPPTENDNPDSGDYNGVNYGDTGPVLPPTENDYLDSGDYNGVNYTEYVPPYYDPEPAPDWSNELSFD